MNNYNFGAEFPKFSSILESVDLKMEFVKNLEAVLMNLSGINSFKVGAELEFYIRCSDEKAAQFFEYLAQFGIHPKKETGRMQYECAFSTHSSFMGMANEVNHYRHIIDIAARRMGIFITFDGKPFQNEPPSSLQVSISLTKGEVLTMKSLEMQRITAGMLENMNSVAYLLMLDSKSYARFSNVHDINRFKNSPINATWGYDNRTVALRAVVMPSGGERIEYRLAPANICPFLLSLIVLYSMVDGFIIEASLPDRTFVDALSVASAKTLPVSRSAACSAFSSSKTAIALEIVSKHVLGS